MKNFIYFESTEGGMETITDIQCAADLSNLSGWLNGICKIGDKKMINWMDNALIGQKYNHRMGCLVRLLDK